ncbi:hypothetical protein TNCT_459341 [Trichonephila clavata]|uniref:Uncharacterized protein n=1 Tax=Trichonephila clavata TaxID=2740835 RepID=A0A8X6GMS1_TRICU|nr:hypothetical protein TNCT_459341 [Trichonephila clavata]
MGRSSDAGSREAQGVTEMREGQTSEETTNEEQSQGKKKRQSVGSSTLPNELQPQELASREKRRPEVKRNWMNRSPSSSLQDIRSAKRRLL